MRRRSRRLLVALAAVAVVLVAARLALDPLATWRTRRALDDLPGMRGRFSDVEVKLLDLSYAIHDLRIEKRTGGGASLPFFEAARVKFGLHGKELLGGHVVARIDLDRPKLNLIQASDEAEAAQAAKPGADAAEVAARSATRPGQEAHETPTVGRKLAELAPFLADRVQIRRGEVLWIDAREPEKPRVWLHDVEATIENFATRAALSRGEPTVLAARGTLQKSGKLSFFATADPLAKKLTFAGQGRLERLRLAELGELLAAKQDVVPDAGTLDLSIRFRAAEGRLSGGIRPFLEDAGTRAAAPGLGPKLKSFLADASLEIFEDDVPGREAVATTIPISGRVDDPDLQLVPTILGVVRNAFVRGLADSVTGLPPPKAKEREGVLEQARRALSPGRGKQPRAQPTEGRK
jgi:uncharacterized protein involved in outer membrane biogenesis